MKHQQYYERLGHVVAALQGLEFVLRAFLTEYHKADEPPVNLDGLAVGTPVAKNSFTNYDSLRVLIKKFNKIIRRRRPDLCVDLQAADVRDMLVHGRVASRDPSGFPLEVVKFGKPQAGQVPVERVVSLDAPWDRLTASAKNIIEQVYRVEKADKVLGLGAVEGPTSP